SQPSANSTTSLPVGFAQSREDHTRSAPLPRTRYRSRSEPPTSRRQVRSALWAIRIVKVTGFAPASATGNVVRDASAVTRTSSSVQSSGSATDPPPLAAGRSPEAGGADAVVPALDG